MKKFGFCIILVLFFGMTFANDDCENVLSEGNSNRSLYEKFLPKAELEIARSHLLSYCCLEKPNLASLSGKCNVLVLGAESPYRYDHLIDIGLRRLDARSKEFYPGMTPDLAGKEWMEFITNTNNIKNPELIFNAYKKYWTITAPILSETNLTSFDENTLPHNLTLHDKYINYCFLAMHMYYNGLGLHSIDLVRDGYYTTCLAMVKNRIQQETAFAVAVSQHHATRMLVDGLQAYTKEFVQNRLMKLFDKIVAISSLFTTLSKQAPLSDACTK